MMLQEIQSTPILLIIFILPASSLPKQLITFSWQQFMIVLYVTMTITERACTGTGIVHMARTNFFSVENRIKTLGEMNT